MGLSTVSALLILVRSMFISLRDITHQGFRVYYMFANMASLNRWRRARGFSD